MGATLTTISAILKELYEPSLQEQLKSETTTLRRVERTSEGITSNVGGKYVVFPIHTSRNAGIGSRLENEVLPAAGNQGTKAAQVPLRYEYGSVKMSGQLFELAKSNAQAFVSAMDLEMNGLKDDLAVDFNRQIYGNGQGIVGTVLTGGTTLTTMTMTHTLWFQEGMLVDIYDTSGVTQKATNRTVSNVTATTVDISGAGVTVVAGDIFVRTGNVGTSSGSVQREITGLGKIIQTSGALFNITDNVWTATINNNGGTNRALSELLMITVADAIRKRGGTTSVIFTNLGVRRAYFNLLQGLRQIVNTQEFTGGFSGLAFTTDAGEIPVVIDLHCPPNSMKYLNEKSMKLYREADWEFMNRDGSMWQRNLDGSDGYYGTMYTYTELGIHRRNSFGSLDDITES